MRRTVEFEDSIVRYARVADTRGVINLCSGAWTEGMPEFLRQALQEAGRYDAADYPPSNGTEALRSAVARHYNVAGCGKLIDLDQVTIAPGATGAIFLAFSALFGPNDEIITPLPGYGLSFHAAQRVQLRVRAMPAWHPPVGTAGWRIDIDEMRKAITRQTAAILICDPDNPTGAVLSLEDWRALKQLAEEHDLLLVVDRTYERFGIRKDPVPTVELADSRTIIASSVSKSLRAAGLRVGWLVADASYDKCLTQVAAILFGGVPSPAQTAVAAAFNALPPDFFHLQAEHANRLQADLSRSFEKAGVAVWPVEGGLFLNVPARSVEAANSAEAWEKLLEMGIGGVPSSVFCDDGLWSEPFVRLSFARPKALLDSGFSQWIVPC